MLPGDKQKDEGEWYVLQFNFEIKNILKTIYNAEQCNE